MSGFNLVEVMVVTGMIGILAAISIPAYTGYVEKGRRLDAKTGLMDIQLQQVQWRSNNTTYTTHTAIHTEEDKDGNEIQVLDLNMPTSTYYTFAVTSNDATTFTATAVPAGAQADDECGTFQINLDGPDYSDANNADSDCW